jgi:xanthine dehydrogenase accessory factor
MDDPRALEAFLAAHPEPVLVRLAGVRGSSPREAGAEMLVAGDALLGTIGGGQLEYMAIDEARALHARGTPSATMDVPLGPEIGQCCGGHVTLALDRLDPPGADALRARVAARHAARPEVLIFGAGHVGRALAAALALLPVRAVLIDSRAAELALAAPGTATRLSPLPEAEVRAARPGSAFVVLTHDHALDFLIAAEALSRADAAYVGLIGSATKRARFRAWCRREGGVDPAALVCPIGAAGSADKRPAVIAAFVAAELMQCLTTAPAEAPAFQQDQEDKK